MATLILFLIILSWLAIGINTARWAVTFALVWKQPSLLERVRFDWCDTVAVLGVVFHVARALA